MFGLSEKITVIHVWCCQYPNFRFCYAGRWYRLKNRKKIHLLNTVYLTIFFFCHCRWAKLRSAMIPSSILMEPLTECMILGLLTAWAVSFLFQWDPISFFLIHITLWFIMDAILIRVVQNGPLPFNKVEFLVSLQFLFEKQFKKSH